MYDTTETLMPLLKLPFAVDIRAAKLAKGEQHWPG